MKEALSVMTEIFFIILKCFGIYFTVISLFAVFAPKKQKDPDYHLRFAVLIPARNEEKCISGIIDSLKAQNYPGGMCDIYVIPNNCTDRTASAALERGAQIIEVSDGVRCKGQALHEAVDRLLLNEKHDAFCVFDADNEAAPNFLSEMNRALISGARAAKSRILSKNPDSSLTAACYDIYFCNANVFLNRARAVLGLPARLIGTGFAVRRDLLLELGGWNTETLTEDAEFYASVVAHGEKIAFCRNAVTYDEDPVRFRDSLVQRRRWMSGIFDVAAKKIPSLHSALLCPMTAGAGFDTLMQFAFAYIQALIIPFWALYLLVSPASVHGLLAAAIGFYTGAFVTGFTALILEQRLTAKTAAALFFYPIFIFSFIPLQTVSLFRRNTVWAHTEHTGVRMYAQKAPGTTAGLIR